MRQYILVIITFCSLLHPGHANDIPAEHQHAIDVARKGNPTEALHMLTQLHKNHGDYKGYHNDFAVLLTWGHKDEEAIRYFKQNIIPSQAPVYVLEAIADAYYRLGRGEQATETYGLVLKKDPKNLNAKIGIIREKINNNEALETLPQLLELSKSNPNNRDILLLTARALESKKSFVVAIGYYDRILQTHPKDSEIIERRIMAINHSGAPILALKKALEHPKIFNEQKLRPIKADQIAILVRWSKIDSDSRKPIEEKYKKTDQAISLIKSDLVPEHNKDDRLYNRRLKFDLISAFFHRDMTREAIQDFENLLKEKSDLNDYPEYVLVDVGLAYLTERDLVNAKEIFNHILKKSPTNPLAMKGLYYTLVDNEEHEAALIQVKKYQTLYKPKIYIGPTLIIDNQDRKMAEEVYSESFTFAELFDEAEDYLKNCIAKAPFNNAFRNNLAELYTNRSLPRAAETETHIGLAIDPLDTALRITQANALLDLNEFQDAEKIILDLQRNFPAYAHVKALSERWKFHNMREFRYSTAYSRNRGTSTLFGKKEFHTAPTLYSSPILYNYRAFVSPRYDYSHYLEGKFNQFYTTAGIEYRGRYLSGVIGINSSRYGKHKIGVLVHGDVTPSDHLTLRGKVDILSQETPARAFLVGTTSNVTEVGAQFLKNESFHLDISAQNQKFTDHNTQNSYQTKIFKRIYGDYRIKIDTQLEWGGSWSKKTNVNYYSPKQDYTGTLQALINHRIYRSYEFDFHHIFTVTAGRHHEKNYGTKTIGAVSYEHEFEYRHHYTVNYGIQQKRASYDGQIENTTMLYLRFNIKF